MGVQFTRGVAGLGLRYFKSNREPMTRRQLARTRYKETEMILKLLVERFSEP